MIEIIPFAPRFADGVVSVILPIQQLEFGIPITLAAQPDLREIPRYYQHGNGNFWVAVSGGEPVGTIALLDIGETQVALRKMFVKADFRGPEHGVAGWLLQTSMDWCRARAVREIYLGTTDKFLAAHRFYAKHGFEEISKALLPPRFPVMEVDTKFFRRILPAHD